MSRSHPHIMGNKKTESHKVRRLGLYGHWHILLSLKMVDADGRTDYFSNDFSWLSAKTMQIVQKIIPLIIPYSYGEFDGDRSAAKTVSFPTILGKPIPIAATMGLQFAFRAIRLAIL